MSGEPAHPRPAGRRRLARIVLAVLVLVHLGALGAYSLYQWQARAVALYLDARAQWRDGHLDVAASEFSAFLAERPRATFPVVLYKSFPTAADAAFALGRVEAERGRVDAALAAFRDSMRLQSGHGRREYRDLLLESGRGTELAAFARQELADDPRSVNAARDLGAALLATGDPRGATAAFDTALALLPAWLATHDPGYRGGLSGEEALLLNLRSVAERLAGDGARADATCRGLGARMPARAHLDRLCLAYTLEAAGDLAGSRAALAGYLPPNPEEEALVRALKARLGP